MLKKFSISQNQFQFTWKVFFLILVLGQFKLKIDNEL